MLEGVIDWEGFPQIDPPEIEIFMENP